MINLLTVIAIPLGAILGILLFHIVNTRKCKRCKKRYELRAFQYPDGTRFHHVGYCVHCEKQ